MQGLLYPWHLVYFSSYSESTEQSCPAIRVSQTALTLTWRARRLDGLDPTVTRSPPRGQLIQRRGKVLNRPQYLILYLLVSGGDPYLLS